MNNFINEDTGLVEKVEYIEDEVPDIRKLKGKIGQPKDSEYCQEFQKNLDKLDIYCKEFKFDKKGNLIADENTPAEAVADIREEHNKLDMPHQSGVESFYCNSTDCLVDKDKLISMALGQGKHKTYQDRVAEVVYTCVENVCNTQARIKELEELLKELKLTAEALAITIHNPDQIVWPAGRNRMELFNKDGYAMKIYDIDSRRYGNQ